MPNCSCGGQILTAFIRQRRPGRKQLVHIPLGKVCIVCRKWQDEPAEGHQVDTNDPHFTHGTGGIAGSNEPPPLDARGIPPEGKA